MAKILVVDDHQGIRETMIELYLEGHETVEAKNGKEAQEKIRGNSSIDLIITDLQMPEMNGIQLIKWVKGKYPEIPVILMSSIKEPTDHGADAFLTKPDLNDLPLILARLLGQKKHLLQRAR